MSASASFKRRAMILAAGRGNRLRPLTDKLPKPLVKVGEFSLIEHHLNKLASIGVEEVVINHAWLGEQIEKHLGNGERFGLKIHYSPEVEGALETAGGIINAMSMLTDGQEPVLVINGDVLTDMDFAPLYRHMLDEHQMAHLIMVPNPTFKKVGDFGLKGAEVTLDPDYTFSGISLLSPNLFKGVASGVLPLAPFLKKAITDKKVTGSLHTGYWNDVGTLQRLEQARKDYLQGLIFRREDES